MSNANTNYQAAGTAATTARTQVKVEWYKKPLILNLIIGAGVIIVALIINSNFQFNLFWKLLLGVALIWGGGKIANTKLGVTSLWGKILKGLGWAIIVLALLNSGLRHAGEKAVNWTDEALTELSGKATNGTTGGGSPNTPAVDEAPVLVPMIHQVGGKERVWVPIGSIMVHVTRPNKAGDGSTIYFDCGSVIEPSALANAPEMKGVQIENTTVNAQYKNELRFTKEVREYLASQHIRLVLVEFEQREGAYRDVRTDCPHTRW